MHVHSDGEVASSASPSLQSHVGMHAASFPYFMCNWVWTAAVEVRASGLCATEDRFVLKFLFATLSISANDCQPLAHDLPCETLLRGEIWHWFRPSKIHHTARLAHSVALSCTHTHTHSLSLTYTHTEACMRHTQNWLVALFGAVATVYWCTSLRGTEESMRLFF